MSINPFDLVPPEDVEAYQRRIEAVLALAVAAGCRVAIRGPLPGFQSRPGRFPYVEIDFEFRMLGPGERAPADDGWMIYELRADGWRGRSVA